MRERCLGKLAAGDLGVERNVRLVFEGSRSVVENREWQFCRRDEIVNENFVERNVGLRGAKVE